MEFNRKIHLLIYGISGIELKEKPNLFDLSIEELSTYCKDKGFALVQAHPFRGGTNVLDSTYLDGIEINCHPLYKNTFSDELITIAKSNHIAITCGCDYHGDFGIDLKVVYFYLSLLAHQQIWLITLEIIKNSNYKFMKLTTTTLEI